MPHALACFQAIPHMPLPDVSKLCHRYLLLDRTGAKYAFGKFGPKIELVPHMPSRAAVAHRLSVIVIFYAITYRPSICQFLLIA